MRDQLAFLGSPPATLPPPTTPWLQHWAILYHYFLTCLKSVNHSLSLSPELFPLLASVAPHCPDFFPVSPAVPFSSLMGFSFSTPLVSVRVPSLFHSLFHCMSSPEWWHLPSGFQAPPTRCDPLIFTPDRRPGLWSHTSSWRSHGHNLSMSKVELIFHPKLASPLCTESTGGTTITQARNVHSLHLRNYQILPNSHPQ